MVVNIEQVENNDTNNTLVTKKAKWQTPSLVKLDVNQTQGGGGGGDEDTVGKPGS